MSDEVANFVNRDKALIAKALDGDRGVLIRATEMIDAAEKNAKQSGVPLDDSDLT